MSVSEETSVVTDKTPLSNLDLAKFILEDTSKQVTVLKEYLQECMRDDRQHFQELVNLIVKELTLKIKKSEELHAECVRLPKLRTFIKFKDFGQEPVYIKKHLNFYHRRLMSKIRLGCLPLSLETGRYCVPTYMFTL